MSPKRKNIIRIITLSCIIIFLYPLYRLIKTNQEEEIKVGSAPPDYLNLFIDSTKVKCKVTHSSKNHEVFSTFDYDSNYNIIVTQLTLNTTKPLHHLVKFDTLKDEMGSDVVYSKINQGYLNLYYTSNYQMIDSFIYVQWSGLSTKNVILNDSMISYSSLLNTFSISSSPDKVPGIFIENLPNENNNSEVALIFKKNVNSNRLFIVILISRHKKYMVNDSLVMNLLKK